MYVSKEKREALKFANKIRAELGYEPVDRLAFGYRHVEDKCPIANTINGNHYVSVGPYAVKVFERDSCGEPSKSHTWITPPTVRKFIKNFDQGKKHKSLDRL